MNGPAPSTLQSPAAAVRTRQVLVTLRDIKRFAQAIGENDPVHFDEAYAATTVHAGVVAPPLFCQSLTYEDVGLEALLPDGSPIELRAPVPAERVVGGSSDYRIQRLVRPGELLTIRSELQGVTAKEGRSGTLYLVQVLTEFLDQQGLTVASELATYIKR